MLSIGALASSDYIAGSLLAIVFLGLVIIARKGKGKNRSKLSPRNPVEDGLSNILELRAKSSDYYSYMESIQLYERQGKIDKSLKYVEKTIPILGQFVDDTKQSFGSFDIGSIPAITTGSRYWSLLEDDDNLTKLKKAIEERKELKKWLPIIEEGFQDAILSKRVKQYLLDNPGAFQNTLGKRMGIPGRKATSIVKGLEKLGIVRREPEKKTYQIYLN